MSKNFYSEINLHLVWHTKSSKALLTPSIEAEAHRLLRERATDTDGVYFHEIGGTENHVHLAISIDPTATISELVGQFKGASSYEINHTNPTRDKLLQWQTGYGVVSFGTKDLPWVVDYIRNQRQHHSRKTFHSRLESVTQED